MLARAAQYAQSTPMPPIHLADAHASSNACAHATIVAMTIACADTARHAKKVGTTWQPSSARILCCLGADERRGRRSGSALTRARPSRYSQSEDFSRHSSNGHGTKASRFTCSRRSNHVTAEPHARPRSFTRCRLAKPPDTCQTLSHACGPRNSKKSI